MRPSIGLGLEAWKPCSLRPIILLETNLCIVSLSEHRCLKDSACLHTTLRHYLCGLQCSLSSLVDVTVISSAQVYSGCIQLHVNVDCPLGSAKDVVPSWQTAIIASLETRLPTYHFTSLTESLSRRQSLSKKKGSLVCYRSSRVEHDSQLLLPLGTRRPCPNPYPWYLGRVRYGFAHLNLGKADKMWIITVLPIPILGSFVVSGVA